MKNLMPDYDKSRLLDLKIFHVMKKTDNSPNISSESDDLSYSFSDLISKSGEFLSQNYFKITISSQTKYV